PSVLPFKVKVTELGEPSKEERPIKRCKQLGSLVISPILMTQKVLNFSKLQTPKVVLSSSLPQVYDQSFPSASASHSPQG
ncbi:hypothetical protein CU097_011553, partial [Rhizopus azygosporus]